MKFFYESLLFLTLLPQLIAVLTPQKQLMSILTGPNYDKSIRPSAEHENATVVKINITIRAILNIDDLKMEFTSQLTLRQHWLDTRLKYDSNGTDIDYVALDDNDTVKIWSPDLFFTNEVHSYTHNTVKPNTYTKIYSSGTVLWSCRLTVTTSCNMDLHHFPFDLQICTIRISPFTNSKKTLLVEWDSENPVSIRGSPLLSRFRFLQQYTGTCNSSTTFASYGCVFINLSFKRQFGYYLINIYMPCALCVMLSWIAFWLGPSVSTRLSVTVTILLTLATQIQGFNQSGSKVSYIRAVDIWTGWCLMFGALAILQSATIAFLIQIRNDSILTGYGNKIASMDLKMIKPNTMSPLAIKIDTISRVGFPLLFSVFVTVYIMVFVVFENVLIPDVNFVENA